LFYIEGDKVDDFNKVVLASTYMKGDAEKWVIPIIRQYMDDTIANAGNTILVENWDVFKTLTSLLTLQGICNCQIEDLEPEANQVCS
jgi:hypothetical protein